MGWGGVSVVDRSAFFCPSCNSSPYRQDPGKNLLMLFSSLPHLSVTPFLSHLFFFLNATFVFF